MNRCQICTGSDFHPILDCGPQPLCNRFVVEPDANEFFHPLELIQCRTCGLIQIARPVADAEIVPRFDWLRYNEPEAHLDHLAQTICSLPNIGPQAVAAGLTYKDDTLLARLKKIRFDKTWRIEPETDLGIQIPGVCSETVQGYLTAERATRLAEKRGPVDVVIARHMYEHASNTRRLLDALRPLIRPHGYVVFEVPDCSCLLENRDYSMPWEEHILYFTPDTFRHSFSYTDYGLVHLKNYPFPVENALVAVLYLNGSDASRITEPQLNKELNRGAVYAGGFEGYVKAVGRYLKGYREQCGKIAVFGGGHTACTYINLMKIENTIDFVVDDHPDKSGLFMPGSGIPILGSQSLQDEEIRLCLLTLSPESEKKVMTKNNAFLERGGDFVSIFPSSENALNHRLV